MTALLPGRRDDLRLGQRSQRRWGLSGWFGKQEQLTRVERVGSWTINPLQQQVETMRELIDLPLLSRVRSAADR